METNDNTKKHINQEQPALPDRSPNGAGDEDIDEVPLFRKKRLIIPLLVFLTIATVAGIYWYMSLQD
ncbi:MAG TPA: hypothetical protein VI758_11780, partial [Bacteroidota bacterium]